MHHKNRVWNHSPHDCEENKHLYDIWSKMRKRCLKQDSPRYQDYGGRGIGICDEWARDFDAFVDWSMANGYEIGLTIDRIDNDGNYEPGNCRWSTRRQQNRNKRTNLMVTYRGETKDLMTWCEELGLKYDPVHHRITHGWDVETAFTKPLTSEVESFASVCRRHGIKDTVVYDRINRLGWTLEKALNTPVHVQKKRVTV